MTDERRGAFTSVLIGGDTLLIECGELLLGAGHNIAAVVSDTPRVANWAKERGIQVVEAGLPHADLAEALSQLSFDWLFAITHLAIIPDKILSLPKRGAINFHDGPLPGYAGLNAPAWALIDGVESYGISWHLITEGVDEGDLVASRTFPVDAEETSLSLNTRNFEQAILAFEELIGDIAAGQLKRSPQDSQAVRRVFRRSDRPDGLALLDWRRTAAEIERLVRALNFGPYANPLGRAGIRHGSAAVHVLEAELRVEAGPEPGTVLALSPEEIVITAADGAVAFRSFSTLQGMPLNAAEAAKHLGIGVSDVLPNFERDGAQLAQLGRRLARNEALVRQRLNKLEAVDLPWATAAAPGQAPEMRSVRIELPAQLAKRFEGREAAAMAAGFGLILARVSGKNFFHLAASSRMIEADVELAGELVSSWAPLELRLEMHRSFEEAVSHAATELDRISAGGSFLTDLIARDPDLRPGPAGTRISQPTIAIRVDGARPVLPGVVAELRLAGAGADLCTASRLIDDEAAAILKDCLEEGLRQLSDDVALPIGRVEIIPRTIRDELMSAACGPEALVPGECLHELIEQQVERSPDAVAIVSGPDCLTYREMDRQSSHMARHLQALGVQPDDLVGIHIERGIDLVVSVLAILKAGAAYVPLDPSYPGDRLRHMVEDSGCRVLISSQAQLSWLETPESPNVVVAAEILQSSGISDERVTSAVSSNNLCYCIYTSGSTGLPKGVLVEHRNVVNFFVGMDDRIEKGERPVWLAMTSLSFDISVLELFYTLSRGFRVVIFREDQPDAGGGATGRAGSAAALNPIDFSLFYFSGDAASGVGPEKYQLLLEGARWADENDFAAVWTPERHFHAFGGLYPNPAVAAAALAAVTKRVSIRAGSVVLPLHHPIRVAEDWSVVDNISNGRVAISVASGWQPNDFVLRPENYAAAKDVMFENIDVVRRLWRGEEVGFPGPLGGEVRVRTLPRPVQAELPLWVTAAGNPETFAQAGRVGANLLTHLLGQTVEQLGPKIDAYRQARAEAGHDPAAGRVTVMLHTFITDDDEKAREIVREPLKAYLGTSLSLLKQYAWAFPAFKKPTSGEAGGQDELANLDDEERDAILEFAFLRYYETSGLFGSAASASAMVDGLKEIGVNEIACLVDFGVATDTVLASLPHLGELQKQSNPSATAEPAPQRASAGEAETPPSFAELVHTHEVTHLQCTPSRARMLTMEEDSRAALAEVRHLFVGGEAFPLSLAGELAGRAAGSKLVNMYGPTETTIWSTAWPLAETAGAVPIGTPIANTFTYVLDGERRLLPPGVPGELWIGGDGVARGYHERPELTCDRFLADPFRPGERMYRTGDLVKWGRSADGERRLEFLGRVDHQVKVRGYRIELGEIEAHLGQHSAVAECVVVARPDAAGDQQLVAFVAARPGQQADPEAIKASLRLSLPAALVPSHIVALSALPQTPNGKIDRNALPSLSDVKSRAKPDSVQHAAPESKIEQQVLSAWHETLGDTSIGVNDNFFDVGGHSLLIVRLQRILRDSLQQKVALTDLYRFPTVRSFVESLSGESSHGGAQRGLDRAARRRQSLQRRAGQS